MRKASGHNLYLQSNAFLAVSYSVACSSGNQALTPDTSVGRYVSSFWAQYYLWKLLRSQTHSKSTRYRAKYSLILCGWNKSAILTDSCVCSELGEDNTLPWTISRATSWRRPFHFLVQELVVDQVDPVDELYVPYSLAQFQVVFYFSTKLLFFISKLFSSISRPFVDIHLYLGFSLLYLL